MVRGWLDLFRSLGEAFLEVMGAEATALQNDLGKSGRRYAVGGALFCLAVFALFWAIGAGAFAAYKILELWVAPWIAAVVVWGVSVLTGMVLWIIARQRWRAIESPTATVRRHVDEHRIWMQSHLLGRSHDGVDSLSAADEAAEGREP